MYHVRALLFFVFGWLSTSVCQMAPFGIENLLFGGLGGFPQQSPMGVPLGIGGLFGQGQYAPSLIGMPSGMGSYSMGQLPFPLFPMPCETICEHGGLFFASININQGGMPGGMPGMPPGGMPPGGMPPGGMPPGGMPPGGMPPGGMPPTGGNRPPGGMPPGGMPTTTRPPGGGMPPTTMPTRPPSMPPMPPMPQSPSVNAQFFYYVPNWCTGWCRFFYRPRPFFPPPPPPPPPPLIIPMRFPHPACLIFSWLGF